MAIPVALTIAGSDSGGGAGIQADIKAMQANRVFATSVLTAITAQNTKAVTAGYDLPAPIIEAQLDAVCDDFDIRAAKTGMLSSAAIIETVSSKIKQHHIGPLVVDPVMISKSGFSLLKPDAVTTLQKRLLPLATVVTPNIHEANLLTGMDIKTVEEAAEAARKIQAMGPAAVLVKGGHLEGHPEAVDVLWDGRALHTYTAPFIDTPHTHGTGCTYSATITAHLARGAVLEEAVGRAKTYVTEAIRHGMALGAGHGPTHHFFFLEED